MYSTWESRPHTYIQHETCTEISMRPHTYIQHVQYWESNLTLIHMYSTENQTSHFYMMYSALRIKPHTSDTCTVHENQNLTLLHKYSTENANPTLLQRETCTDNQTWECTYIQHETALRISMRITLTYTVYSTWGINIITRCLHMYSTWESGNSFTASTRATAYWDIVKPHTIVHMVQYWESNLTLVYTCHSTENANLEQLVLHMYRVLRIITPHFYTCTVLQNTNLTLLHMYSTENQCLHSFYTGYDLLETVKPHSWSTHVTDTENVNLTRCNYTCTRYPWEIRRHSHWYWNTLWQYWANQTSALLHFTAGTVAGESNPTLLHVYSTDNQTSHFYTCTVLKIKPHTSTHVQYWESTPHTSTHVQYWESNLTLLHVYSTENQTSHFYTCTVLRIKPHTSTRVQYWESNLTLLHMYSTENQTPHFYTCTVLRIKPHISTRVQYWESNLTLLHVYSTENQASHFYTCTVLRIKPLHFYTCTVLRIKPHTSTRVQYWESNPTLLHVYSTENQTFTLLHMYSTENQTPHFYTCTVLRIKPHTSTHVQYWESNPHTSTHVQYWESTPHTSTRVQYWESNLTLLHVYSTENQTSHFYTCTVLRIKPHTSTRVQYWESNLTLLHMYSTENQTSHFYTCTSTENQTSHFYTCTVLRIKPTPFNLEPNACNLKR